jgi:hypothetical protein
MVTKTCLAPWWPTAVERRHCELYYPGRASLETLLSEVNKLEINGGQGAPTGVIVPASSGLRCCYLPLFINLSNLSRYSSR